jgi:hypothetical protein
MLFFKQVFLRSNCALMLPQDAQIRKVVTENFYRKGRRQDVPAVVYSWGDAGGMVSQRHQTQTLNNSPLRRIRMFIVPHSAYDGTAFVTYAAQSSIHHTIYKLNPIQLGSTVYDSFVEEDTPVTSTEARQPAAADNRVPLLSGINENDLIRRIG